MINLLPPGIKQDIAYARHNTKLIKWSLALIFGAVGTGLVVMFGMFYMNRSINAYSSQVEKITENLKVQKLEDTQKRVEDISSSLKLIIQVLSREILFSKLIKQIGTVMPANSSLTDLKISKTEGGIDLSAAAANYNTATQVQVNLQDPANKIFDKADIINIICVSSGTPDPRYPCTVSIRAQFTKNNPFLFISTSGSAN